MEIERKFRMTQFPDLPYRTEVISEIHYLSIRPYIRMRKAKEAEKVRCKMTFKGEGDLSRNETEIEISEAQFEDLKKHAVGEKPLYKKMRIYPLSQGLEMEVSCVCPGEENEFYYAEIEFPDEKTAAEFPLPTVLGEEVTYEKQMKMNHVYARYNGLE